MRYLLDELMAYEEGFTDIMMTARTSDRHETFMGLQDPGLTVTKADLIASEVNILAKIEGIVQRYSGEPFMFLVATQFKVSHDIHSHPGSSSIAPAVCHCRSRLAPILGNTALVTTASFITTPTSISITRTRTTTRPWASHSSTITHPRGQLT
jgi:hypothetical protein